MIDDVDVVVVGGGTGAVAAAISAAEEGADVFLVAPYPYLGDDMTATLRMWLEPGEVPTDPLAKAIFEDHLRAESVVSPERLPFSYEASVESSSVHRDTDPPAKLADGKCSSASAESVQYDGDVVVTTDLGETTEIAELQLLAFFRANAPERERNFKVGTVAISLSEDGETWTEPVVVQQSGGIVPDDGVSRFELPLEANARYVRFDVKKAEDVDRILLGEIVIIPPVKDDPNAEKKAIPSPRPMHVKRVLDQALLDAGVKYLYSTYVTDIVRSPNGNAKGVVTVNRSGRQAIHAHAIIDATPRADVARMAGAKFRPFPAGKQKLEFTVIGGEPQEIEGASYEIMDVYQGPWPNPTQTDSGRFSVINYTFEMEMADASWPEWCRVEQKIRDLTYHEQQQFTADQVYQVPMDSVIRPVSGSVMILGPCADIPREDAAELMRPLNYIATGRRFGRQAAELAAISKQYAYGARGPSVEPVPPVDNPAATGDVAEVLIGARPVDELPMLPCPATSLPVLGEYDVVVIGGGTCGAPAGIGAGRAAKEGQTTLVVEYLHTFGGVGTTGAISSYYWGNRVGFTATVPGDGRWVIEQKMNWWRSNLLDAGAELWCGTLGVGAFVEGNEVKGVVVATPQGRGVVLAKTVIDTTGNSDIAYAAGAECMYTDEKELAVQGTGLPPRQLGASYANTDFTLVDETDSVDVWHVFIYSKDKYASTFDHGKLIDTRERRRIVGEFTMNLLDQLNHRTYPDTVAVAYSNFDTHGYTVDPYLELEHPEKVGHYVSVPYRCTLPRDLEGILVGGLGISCHRDAIPLVRMQADLQNLGYALGRAAMTAADHGINPRDVDVNALQQHLIEIGNLPEDIRQMAEDDMVSAEELAAAVATLPNHYEGIHVVMWADRDAAHAAVRKAFVQAEADEAADAYAQVLAVMGDPIGVDRLTAQAESLDAWDAGWNYRGMGQFGSALSPMDRLILALGRSGDSRAVPVIVEKMQMLSAEDDFSHHRACSLALEMLADPKAAPALAEHLTKPGMAGFTHHSVEQARAADQASPGGTNAVKTRRDSLRELGVARALYRCGDYDGLGETVLRSYVKDLRGHYARHAKAVLETPVKLKSDPPVVPDTF